MSIQHARKEIFVKISQENWDLIVIGGGITGAGITREAVRQNLKVLLIEQQDFASGTSSRSTKMVHGGIRYLKEGDIRLTYQSVRERQNLIRELPGLVEDKIYILPFYKGGLAKQIVTHMGLIFYDLLAFRWRKHKFSKQETKQLAPDILKTGLKGGFNVSDAIADDARLVMRVLWEATNEGAIAINYCRADELLKENNMVCGVKLTDVETGNSFDIKSKLVVNATGAWADRLRRYVKKINKQNIRPLRGSHLIFSKEQLPLVENVFIIHPDDNRPLIVMSWEGSVLVGTTDIDHKGDLGTTPGISQEEVKYLLDAIHCFFPDIHLEEKDIVSTMAGIRPVIDTGKENPSEESRDHVIWQEDGLLSVTGGKLTTFRLIALDALQKAQETIGVMPNLKKKYSIFTPLKYKLVLSEQISVEKQLRLQGYYGNNAHIMVENAQPEELETIPGTNTLWVELKWAAQEEAVVHLDDLLLRRTRIGNLVENGAKNFLPRIRSLCQSKLGWDDEKWDKEEQDYLDLWEKYYSVPRY